MVEGRWLVICILDRKTLFVNSIEIIHDPVEIAGGRKRPPNDDLPARTLERRILAPGHDRKHHHGNDGDDTKKRKENVLELHTMLLTVTSCVRRPRFFITSP